MPKKSDSLNVHLCTVKETSVSVQTPYSQERIKVLRELIPHIGPLPMVIPLKLFLERIGFPADNISSRVAWKFRGVIKLQKHVGSARVILS